MQSRVPRLVLLSAYSKRRCGAHLKVGDVKR
jgi:hypothetical protein